MNDFIYVPITEEEYKSLSSEGKLIVTYGFDWDMQTVWLKKLPASEYLKSISSIQGEAVSDAVELLTCPHCKSFDSIYIESEYGKEDELDDFAENVHYQIATCQKCGDSCSPIELFKNRNNE